MRNRLVVLIVKKRFTQKSNLTTHMKTHTRKKGRKQRKTKPKARTRQQKTSIVPESARSTVEQPPEATEEEHYEVQAIVDDKIEPDGQHLYKVRWKGYPPSEDTWQPETQTQDPLNTYKQQRSRKRPAESASHEAKRRKR